MIYLHEYKNLQIKAIIILQSGFVDWLYDSVIKNTKSNKTKRSKSKGLIKEIHQELIIDTVCRVFKVEKAELLKRRSVFREARMAYIDLCCKHRLLHKSLKEIGRELGDLTVGGMGQIRKRLKKKLQENNSFRIKYDRCNKVIQLSLLQ